VSPPLTACLFVHPEGSLPKPSISVSPGGVIPVGGNVTIRCRHQHLGMRFLLYKAGVKNYLNYTDAAGSEAQFPITSARREHGGNYTCRYSNITGPVTYSKPSDPVQIIVAGEGPSPESRLPAPHPARAQGVSVSPDAQQMGRPAQPLKVGWRGDILDTVACVIPVHTHLSHPRGGCVSVPGHGSLYKELLRYLG
uniref:Immunoglobulin domain-containing protein n=1 Tax=Chrysemys picta bellii TaxID=8478 RepID=A0A8C3HUI6_CHRPI